MRIFAKKKKNMMPIHFAPIQGYTDYVYRNAHHVVCGGIEAYYTPFVRWERGSLRNKDIRDILPENNEGTPVIVQVIAGNVEEFSALVFELRKIGIARIDLNLGCPFPLQIRQRHGAGLLPHPDIVRDIVDVMGSFPEISFSVKARLGLKGNREIFSILPILNDAPLNHVTIHPRIASQMYKGPLDLTTFAECLSQSTHPTIFNGEVDTLEKIHELERIHPQLGGVMIGRGLLCNPTLAAMYQDPESFTSDKQSIAAFWKIHDQVYDHAILHFQGDSQILAHLHALWEYPSPILSKKSVKGLLKCGNLKNYDLALKRAKEELQ